MSEQPPEKKSSKARSIIGLILVLALGGSALAEILANRSFNAAVQRLDERVGDDLDPEKKPTLDEVNEILAKAPTGPESNPDESILRKTYTWNGIFRKYAVTAEYNDRAPYRLMAFETGMQ